MNDRMDSKGKSKSRMRATFALLGLAILAAAVFAAVVMIRNKPRAGRREAMRVIPVVEVMNLAAENRQVNIECAGTVIAADEMDVQPLVAGQILKVHPDLVEGGVIKAGEVLAEIDPADYELQVAQQQAALDKAESALRLEQGQQAVAEREWELLGDEGASRKDRELALRKPQLKAAQAAVDAARASLEQAKLNVARARVTAPANGVVAAVYADAGDRAVPGQPIARIVSTDRYYVRGSVPVNALRWIDVSSGRDASPAAIQLSSGAVREGRVVRLLPDLEAGSRMARILVELRDPLDMSGNSLDGKVLLGDYVRVTVKGRELKDVLSVPLEVLRDGRELWWLDGDARLHIQPVDIVWMGRSEVYVSNGNPDGWRLIVSDLGTPIEGMELRIAGEGEAGGRP